MQYSFASILALTSAVTATHLIPHPVPIVHQVKVSNFDGQLIFQPADISASMGDFVQFFFYPMNHSVVQSSFDKPCVPIEESEPSNGPGFFSGYVPKAKGESPATNNYTIEITDVTKPMWFYCSQGKHCQNGMVGVINADANNTKTLDDFKALAKTAPMNLPAKMKKGAVDLSLVKNAVVAPWKNLTKDDNLFMSNGTSDSNTTSSSMYDSSYTSSAADSVYTMQTTYTVADSTVTTTITAPLADMTDSSYNSAASAASTATTSSTSSSSSSLVSSIAQSNSASGLVGGSPLSLLGMIAAGVFFLA